MRSLSLEKERCACKGVPRSRVSLSQLARARFIRQFFRYPSGPRPTLQLLSAASAGAQRNHELRDLVESGREGEGRGRRRGGVTRF